MNILKAAATVGSWTAVSRVLGMVREILMSHYMGVSIISDAFVVAFKFPNFFRRFFAEGAFNAAFVPQFAGKLAADGMQAAQRLGTDVFILMTWFLFGFVLLVEVTTPYLIPIIAPGFSGGSPERLELAITFTRITFPYIFFISLTALLSGMLTSVDRFWAASAAPILLNITMIVALLLTPILHIQAGLPLSTAVFIAGLLQLTWLYMACKRQRLAPALKLPTLSPDALRVLKLMVPGMIGAGVMQINMLIDLQLASLLPIGAMSYLYYADRLYQLPMSVFGVAIGTALLPSLSKLWRANNRDEAIALQNKSLIFVLFMNIPAAIGLILLSNPLISLLFGHGAFSADDVSKTAPVLAAYAVGLPAYVVAKVFSTTFFAQNDTKTPVRVGIWVIGINLILNLIFMPLFQHVGLAIATSCSAYIQVFMLGWYLRKQNLLALNKEFTTCATKIIGTSVLMTGLIFYTTPLLISNILYFNTFKFLKSYTEFLSVLIGTGLGITFYMATSYGLGTLKVIKNKA